MQRSVFGSIGMLCIAASISAFAQSVSDLEPERVELRGRVVCIPEYLHERFGADIHANHEHDWGFKTGGGQLLALVQTRLSEALFLDERLREKELLIKGRIFPNSRIFEAINIRSIRDGAVHDLYYYCDVCAIKSVTPELCACCQAPVELVEEPL